jgi:hypothetical protein
MGPLIPFVMRREYQTHKVEAVWAFHSQAASCLPSRFGFRAPKSHPHWLADGPFSWVLRKLVKR